MIITDKRKSVCDEYLAVDYFEAEVIAAMDYYPGGMLLPGRQWYAGNDSTLAINGFNGMRNDHEINGHGNSLDFGARIYNSRLVRWMSVDPLQSKYPSLSAYQFVANNPISLVDPDGRKIIKGGQFTSSRYGTVLNTMMAQNNSSMTKLLSRFMDDGADITLYAETAKQNTSFENPLKSGFESNGVVTFNLSTQRRLPDTRVSGSDGTETNIQRFDDLNDLGRASALVHEIIHANVTLDVSRGLIDPSNYSGPHEIIAQKYMAEMIGAITELNTANNWNLTKKQIEVVAWAGMEGSESFRKVYMKENYGVELGSDSERWTPEEKAAFEKYETERNALLRKKQTKYDFDTEPKDNPGPASETGNYQVNE